MLLFITAVLCPQGLSSALGFTSTLPSDGLMKLRVTMPGAEREIEYDIKFSERLPAHHDSLALCDYLIRWTSESPSGPVEGFSAYRDGAHYRYRDGRLQEYHWDWDSVPFKLRVQEQAQFVQFLPTYVISEIDKMTADSTMTLSKNGNKVRAIVMHQGVVAAEKNISFDDSGQLKSLVIESNPGSIAEQTIEIEYSPQQAEIGEISEQMLSQLYPDAFGKHRESNFKIENLVGEYLPKFSLPTATGERYSREIRDGFAQPTILALMDPETLFSNKLVKDLRESIESLPMNVGLIVAMTSTNTDLCEETMGGRLLEGENLLINARSLARDCGAASLPVVIFVNSDGKVQEVLLGYNKDFSTNVLQRAMTLK